MPPNNGTALREQVMQNSSALSEVQTHISQITRVLKAIQDTLHVDKARADALQHAVEELLEDLRHPQGLQDLVIPRQNREAILHLQETTTVVSKAIKTILEGLNGRVDNLMQLHCDHTHKLTSDLDGAETQRPSS